MDSVPTESIYIALIVCSTPATRKGMSLSSLDLGEPAVQYTVARHRNTLRSSEACGYVFDLEFAIYNTNGITCFDVMRYQRYNRAEKGTGEQY